MLVAWMTFVTHRAGLVLGIIGLITVGAAWYAVDRFSMNSDTSRLIRQDTPWKAVHTDFITTFPQYDQNTLVVISGSRPHALSAVTRALAAEIRLREETFSMVLAPTANEFVDQNSLLYLNQETLNDTVSKLADAQPFLTAVAKHDNLRGILMLLSDALTTDEQLPAGLQQITDALDLAASGALEGSEQPISWRDELFKVNADEIFYHLILVKGRQEFGEDLPNGLLISELQAAISAFEHPFKKEATIRVSGQVPLEHGEIVSAMNSAQVAGSLAMVLLIIVLVWGVRSLRIIAATYLTMTCGLIWTAAFAMMAVGQYNTISIIFLVMFIGLGVDFAIHLCLKYQESLNRLSKEDALIETGAQLGPAIMLCGVTSAIGFLAFVPTDYIGLAEMGIISGGGMIIAVGLSLTLIPAFFAIVKPPKPPAQLAFAGSMAAVVAKRPRQTAWFTLLVACMLAAIATQARFDYSTLSLKDPESEAMMTLKELHEADIVTDYALTIVADNRAMASGLKKQLLMLDVVSDVKTPEDYLPDNQKEKRFILDDAGFLLDSVFYLEKDTTKLTDEDLVGLMSQLSSDITSSLEREDLTPELLPALHNLKRMLSELQAADPSTRKLFTQLIIPPLQQEIDWLQNALSAEPLDFSDLPQQMRDRVIASNDRILISVTPSEDVVPVEAMRRFTEAVLAITPKATGRPVLDLGIGEIVTTAFATALSIAVLSIFIILLMTLRSVTDAILVFIPLIMTAMLTLTVSVVAGLPLNMANVVVIPLIFGLGVDNGIHIVKRYHQVANVAELVRSSTPRAVFLSNLTTLGTFCALSFSTHQGIYSIGVLLTIALLSLMILTLISLPALLATFSRPTGYNATNS